MLAQLRQEEVFKSISDNVGGSADPRLFYFVGGITVVVVLVLTLVNLVKKRQALPRHVNHHGRLIKELQKKKIPLKSGELRQLKIAAAEQGCQNPLTLILCPSLLAKRVNARGKADRKTLLAVARKMGIAGKKAA